MSDDALINGFIVKDRTPKQPDFVLAKVSLKLSDVIADLTARMNDGEEWVNLDIQRSKGGKLYAKVNDWKPDAPKDAPPPRPAVKPSVAPYEPPPMDDDQIPFN